MSRLEIAASHSILAIWGLGLKLILSGSRQSYMKLTVPRTLFFAICHMLLHHQRRKSARVLRQLV